MVRVEGKLIHFGAKGYDDYTIHKDKERKRRYLLRHGREDWTDYKKAGFWSRWVLWNKKSIRESIADLNRRFGLNVRLG